MLVFSYIIYFNSQMASSGQQSSQIAEAKRAKEYRPRMQRKPSSNSQDSETNSNFGGKGSESNIRAKLPEPNSDFGGKSFLPIQDSMEIREAKVSSVSGSNSASKIASDYEGRYDVSNNVSPTKSSNSDVKTSSFEPPTSTSQDGLLSYSEDPKDADDLEQFEALEKELGLGNNLEFR